jgi:carbamoyltransferase
VKDALNARVKFREPFRPFAPSVAVERCGNYFDSATPSPFMLRVYQTRGEFSESLGAVTHVDGGARVQTVSQLENGAYLDLIRAYGSLTGISCVLNTSFNIRGEPIVNTPQDALKCFFTTDMDDLYLGPFHLEK